MARGFKRDNTATLAALFRDNRSFISLPKVTPHTNGVAESHVIAYGVDVIPIREECLNRSAIKNGEPRCRTCGSVVNDYLPETHPAKSELHHLAHKPWDRCWCSQNLAIICHKCHQIEHENRKPWPK